MALPALARAGDQVGGAGAARARGRHRTVALALLQVVHGVGIVAQRQLRDADALVEAHRDLAVDPRLLVVEIALFECGPPDLDGSREVVLARDPRLVAALRQLEGARQVAVVVSLVLETVERDTLLERVEEERLFHRGVCARWKYWSTLCSI